LDEILENKKNLYLKKAYLSEFINDLFEYRNIYDYNVEAIPDDITAKDCLNAARRFYDEVKKYFEVK